MEQQKVWAPCPSNGFSLGIIQDISSDGATVMVLSDKKTYKFTYDSLYPSGELTNQDYDDNCALMYLNEGSLLNNLRIRYEKDQIYTYVANILIAINPYFDISNLYSKAIIQKYQGKSIGTLPPHLFALADKSFRDLKCFKKSQSIIVSGESGAGKTESTKYVLRYLCESWSNQSGQIEKLILDANPVLEAFGNAKTVRNNNSSRFGKFIEIHFNQKCSVAGGHISHYLLEKSRIITQSKDERNYHIFYQLISGLNQSQLDELYLKNPEFYNYLKFGCTRFFGDQKQLLDKNRCSNEQLKNGFIQDPIVNDKKDFINLELAFTNFGLNEQTRWNIFRIVAAVLHLGNIDFEEATEDTRGGCRILPSSENELQITASLIKIEPNSLRQCLLTRIMQTSKGGMKGTVYMVPLKPFECRNARDALAKALYSKLFDYIVSDVINKSFPNFESSYYIGVLDIAGFEYFQVNSFEQFCINYCNEKLQQFFNERILNEEQRIYENECLQLKKISFQDNSECIQLIEKPSTGILHLLNEENKLPKSSNHHFTEQVHLLNKNHFHLQIPRKSELKIYRNLRDDEGFIIRHFAGAVCYNTEMFLEKNNDALHNSLQCLMLESTDDLVKQLFNTNSNSSSSNNCNNNGKLNLVSISGKFKQQLSELMGKLNSTGTHFIRCIKPNQAMVKKQFEGASVLSQLRCSGMKSVMELMHQGYPSRTLFFELYKMYEEYLPLNLRKLEPRMFCRILFKAIGLNENDYKFGLTKVFFKAGKFSEFDQLMKSDPQHLAELINKTAKFLLITRWKIYQWGALSVIKLKNKIKYREQFIITIQKNLRMCNKIAHYRPLYKGLAGIRKLFIICNDLSSQLNQLNEEDEHNRMNKEINLIKERLVNFQKVLKNNQIPFNNEKITFQQAYQIKQQYVDEQLSEINIEINKKLSSLRMKITEQIKLKEMKKKIEEEKRKLEEEEQKRKEEEERRRKKEEIEQRCLKEKEELERQELLLKQQKQNNHLKQQLINSNNLTQQVQSFSNQINQSNSYVSSSFQDDFTNFELTEEIIKEDSLQRKRLEQEKIDHYLALRLASEMDKHYLEQQIVNNNQINETSSPLQVSSDQLINGLKNLNLKPGQELDLSKWKYSELRDIINTSCDLVLLECCRKEFHRRLKVYHSWKMKNKQQQKQHENQELRAPDSIMKNAMCLNSTSNNLTYANKFNEQRYFRIPFVKPSSLTGEKGWWWAHFNGQWIARQMEIHPNKKPLLLKAGIHDMQMCELSLDETRLTSKRGAEILADEFEAEWIKNESKK